MAAGLFLRYSCCQDTVLTRGDDDIFKIHSFLSRKSPARSFNHCLTVLTKMFCSHQPYCEQIIFFYITQNVFLKRLFMSFKLSEPLSTSISPDKADKCPFQRWTAPTVCQRTVLEAPNETFSALHLSEHTQLNTRVRDERWLFSKVKMQLSVKGRVDIW